jgi:signal transduction histidine kinase
VGVPSEKQGRIFEAFLQADGTTARKYGGSGLGLTICQHLAELI